MIVNCLYETEDWVNISSSRAFTAKITVHLSNLSSMKIGYLYLLISLVYCLAIGASHAQTTISYAQASYCTNGADPTPSIIGITGGSFFSTTGLVLNPTSGLLDVSASIAGSYTVSYLNNNDTATTTVQIIGADDASFSYLDSVYCSFGISDTPIVATAGGIFTSQPTGFNTLCLDSISGVIGNPNCGSSVNVYTVSYTTRGACPAVSTQQVAIALGASPFFIYPGNRVYCQNEPDVVPVILGDSAGFFTAPVGVVLDPSTGVIDLSASVPGSYIITRVTTGFCAFFSDESITILPADDARFAYGDSVYCRFGNDPTPTITGLSGGSFSSSAGLALDSLTGRVNLTGSLIDQFTVFYTTNGSCPNTDSVLIQVDTLDDASFAYDTTNYCQNGGVIVPTITGEAGGSFFSIPFGLALDNTTGNIDLPNSNTGNYTIIYTTTNPCSSSSTFDIDIDGVPSFIFDYPLDTYCLNDSSRPRPVQLPSVGFGNATADQVGLSLSNTGILILERSLAGVYVVTYVTNPINNLCQVTYTDTITVLAPDNASFSYGAVRFCATDPPITPFLINNSGGTFSANSNNLALNSQTGTIDFGASTAGTYIVTYTTAGFCATVYSETITIDPFPNASFAYGANAYCLGATNPQPTITGISGGRFSSRAGLIINVFSGELDLNTSTAGTYTVFYSLTASCSATDSTVVTIGTRDDATFTYPQTTYCQSEPDAVPTFTGTTGGSFTSSPTGLAYDLSTGVLDLSASTAGTYTITYTTTGTCPDSRTLSIIITPTPSAAFGFAKTTYCLGEPNPSPSITGSTGGRFVGSNGLPIDILFGQIDLTAATAGTYTVFYQVGTSNCADTSSVVITIGSPDSANFSYPQASYCQNEPAAVPTRLTTGGNFTSTPLGLAYNLNAGIIDLGLSIPGIYTITYRTNGNCPDSSSQMLTVFATPSAAFAFAKSVYCLGEPNPSPTITGTTGGQFSGSTGLLVNASLGELDLLATPLGTYTVTYRVNNGTCANSDSTTVTIALADSASFAYTDTFVCVNGGNNIVLGATSNRTGTYSASPAGVTFVNTSTGEIDVSNTLAGTYLVKYITNGNCPDTASIQLDATFCLGQQQLTTTPNYGVFPNPNNGTFYLVYEGEASPTTIRVVDALGRVVYEENNVWLNQSAYEIQLPKVAAGAYWLMAQNDKGIWRSKVVVAQP